MNKKIISKILYRKFNTFLSSIDDQNVRNLVSKNTIITGGSIANMLIGEKINDYDLYFTNKETVEAVTQYYINKIPEKDRRNIKIEEDDNGRIKIFISSAGIYKMKKDGDYSPLCFTDNAITLSNKIQVIIRFYGDANKIHENFDFIHCCNYWTSNDNEIVLKQEALESLLAKQLKYSSSKYPVCSIFRIRKFLKRGWTINAGELTKIMFHISLLDLTDIEVLREQLIGVDSAYFIHVIDELKEQQDDNEINKITESHLFSIIDKAFN